MDVIGIAPDHECGVRFRVDMAGWRQLWDVTAEYSDGAITPDLYHAGQSNAGAGLDAATSSAVAHALQRHHHAAMRRMRTRGGADDGSIRTHPLLAWISFLKRCGGCKIL